MATPIVILHNTVEENAPIDERDVLVQVLAIEDALATCGYSSYKVMVDLDTVKNKIDRAMQLQPYCVFNLVESLDRTETLMPIVPLILEAKGIPFTGCGALAMLATGNKARAKKIMSRAGIPSPPWQSALEIVEQGSIAFEPPYIVKSSVGHGSSELEASSFFSSADACLRHVLQAGRDMQRTLIVERYIDGREFNVSLLEIGQRMHVLPPAEICFMDWAQDKPKIVGYRAKWDPDSWEYHHTPRKFTFTTCDAPLLQQLQELCATCWDIFGLRGYARVDFRIDRENRPWILEVNANPCLSPDAGMAAAALQQGMAYPELVETIVACATGGKKGIDN